MLGWRWASGASPSGRTPKGARGDDRHDSPGGADEVGGGPARTGKRRCRAGKGGGGARQTWALPERDEQGANGEARGVRQCREGQPVAWPRGSGGARSMRARGQGAGAGDGHGGERERHLL